MPVKVEINGSVVEFDRMPSHDDIDHAATQLTPQATTTTPTTTAAPASGLRRGLQVGGGLLGGGLGALSGGIPAVAGAVGGAGLGSTAADVLEGKMDWQRGGVQALGAAAAQALAPEAGLGLSLVRGGLASGIAGKVYDLAHDFMVGGPKQTTLKQAAVGTAWDVLGGALGEGLSRAAGQARPNRRAAVQTRREQFARAGITPKASELAGSGALAQLEATPARLPIGGGRPRRFEAQRMEEARTAAERMVQGQSPRTEPDVMRSGQTVQQAIKEGKSAFRTQSAVVFQEIEDITGNEPVVPTTRLKSMARALLRTAQRTPYGTPGGTSKLANVSKPETVYEFTGRTERGPVPTGSGEPSPPGAPPGSGIGGPERPGVYPPGIETTGVARTSTALTPYVYEGEPLTGQEDVETLIFAAMKQDHIPFWLARRIESQLGEMAFKRTAPIGTIRQGQAGALYKAVRSDLDEFLTSDVGTEIAPRLAQAKQWYGTSKEMYNHSVVRSLYNAKAPESVIHTAFTPGNVSDTLDFKQAVPDEVYERAVQGWLKGLYDHAVTPVGDREVFSPRKFATAVQKYEKNGHLDVILPPEQARELRNLVAVFNQMRYAAEPGVNPSGTGQSLLSATQFGALAGAPFVALMGQPGRAATDVAIAGGLPMALGQLTTRPGGINALTRAATGDLPRVPPWLMQALNRFGGQTLPLSLGGSLRPPGPLPTP